ncbi:hypothetical protein, partial [Rhodoferax sp.]|uniref:hypothetical protein n=1 Tax=Rhodoferax sp. TaxID=50421 RepID=UPI00274BBB69|nr:hypothetical protein [Rhodoferax sp.]
MQHLDASSTIPARELLAQTHAAGRTELTPPELQHLFGTLGVAWQPQADPASSEPELRVRLDYTREFGLVMQAGLGGLDGQLDAANFQPDRASVHAVVALTDAADFLRLFQRSLAYQKLVLWRQSRSLESPDAVLSELFGRLLALAHAWRPEHPSAPLMLARLDMDGLRCSPTPHTHLGECAFVAPPRPRLPRPIEKIEQLIHP